MQPRELYLPGLALAVGLAIAIMTILGGDAHALGYVLLHPPLFPVALRGDALFSKTSTSGTALSLIGDVVFLAPLPIVQPYALVGYGRYGVGKDGQSSGANAGIGVRVHLSSLSVFGEARRHQRISHDLLTIGISL